MENPWVLFAFVSIFHIIGAAVLGTTLRQFWHPPRERGPQGCRLAFLTVWAAMFGCLPFGFGIGLASRENGTPLLLVGEAVVWTGAFLSSLLASQQLKRFLEPFLTQDVAVIVFGGGFLVGGVMTAALVARDSDAGWAVGGLFGIVGAAMVAHGLWRLFRSTC